MSGYRFGVLTILMLVALRVGIGWHFFKEGLSHYQDPKWSSEPFLRGAKGPLAEQYQSVLPDAFAWYDEAGAGDTTVDESKPAGDGTAEKETPRWRKWADDVARQWESHRIMFAQFYDLDADRQKRTIDVFNRYKTQLGQYLESEGEAIDEHLHERQRLAKLQAEQSASEVSYQQSRVAAMEKEQQVQADGWNRQIRNMQASYHLALKEILDESQLATPAPELEDGTRLAMIDKYLTYGLMGVGGCLIIGMFTRLASLAGALFLLSVALAQPFWVAGTQPTYNQVVEMLALLSLATTPVGRWGGLDFFIHHLITWPFRAAQR